MKMLPETHPRVHDQLIKRGYCSAKAEGIKFSKAAVDHCIEQTFNCYTKTRSRGDIIGISLKKGVAEKWIPTAHARAALTNECRQLAGLNVETAVANKDTQISKIKRRENGSECL